MGTQLHNLAMLRRHFRRYGVSAEWLKTEAEEGRIPCFWAGKRLLFDPEAVERSLIERAQSTDEGTSND